MKWIERMVNQIFLVSLALALLTGSQARPLKTSERLHYLVRNQAFDYTTWTWKALWVKLGQAALGSPRYFLPHKGTEIVREYIRVVEEAEKLEADIARIYADPAILDAQEATTRERAALQALQARQAELGPFAEAALEAQVTQVAYELGLTTGGQPIPWVLYHVTPLPQNLVVSPRSVIRQETSYLVSPDLTIDESERLENLVSGEMNVSTLVVPVGGIALYPTMVMRTTSLGWQTNTVAHEWIHVYLAYRPLGLNYATTPELRTMNETTASIAGDEIGRMVIERYYPEFAERLFPGRQLASASTGVIGPGSFPPPFDFRAEMHETRVTADALLAEGKIEEAEAYMEARRQIFWNHGYAIRKLNQAYFAFYGAYADTPGGAAGEDPVGPAVRNLRARSASLKEFIDIIGAMDSFEQLQAYLGQ
jgi:hypothetical protein